MNKKNINEFDSYLIEHLKKYIKYHLERGYSNKSIKNALIKFGYSNKMLDSIIKEIKIVHTIIEKPYSDNDLEGETYYYLRGMIVEYIKKQLSHGFDKHEIKKALIKFGHSDEIVKDAFSMVFRKQDIKMNRNTMFWINVSLISFFIVFMSLLLEVPFIITFIIFSPGIGAFIVSKIALDLYKPIRKYLYLISIILSIILFFFIFPALNRTEADSDILLALNAGIAMITTYLYSITEEKKETKRDGNKS
jgi:hypothetical protein